MRIAENIRESSWSVIALTVLVQAVVTLIVSVVLFQGYFDSVLGPLYPATGFLINPTLVASLFNLAVAGGVIFGWGRLRSADVGWRLKNLRTALPVTLGFWIVLQAALALGVVLGGRDLTLNPEWQQRGVSFVVGGVIAQLFGNALVEETVFRGFLLPQFYLKALKVCRSPMALVAALVGSTLIFALYHIPHRLLVMRMDEVGQFLADQGALLLIGMIFASVYLVTRNLFIAVAVHGLTNHAAPLVEAPEILVKAVSFGLILLLLMVWIIVRFALQTQQRVDCPQPESEGAG